MNHLDPDNLLPNDFSVTNHGNKYNPRVSFQNFPGEVGWTVNTATGELTETEVDGMSRKPELQFKFMMQSWLFFGLITAVVFDDNNMDGWKFDSSKFDDTKGKGTITTAELPKVLEAWRKREISQDGKPGQKMRMIRAQLALDLARKVVNTYCSADSPKSGRDGYQETSLDSKVALSLMVIGETLSIAKARIIAQIGFSVRGWYGDATIGWGIPRKVIKAMHDEGWCPRTVQLLKSQLRNNASAFLTAYASHERSHFKGHYTARCVKDQPCKVNPLRNQEYVTKHHPQCIHQKDDQELGDGTRGITCHRRSHEMLGVPSDEVIQIINRGEIPLVKFQEVAANEEPVLELTDASREPDYATISHVWADGYGNSTSNALYRCQIVYFRRLLEEAQVHRVRYRRGQLTVKPKPLAFWMDTLIIPVGSEESHKAARKKAIHQIYTVFSGAKYTIVVDNGLSGMSWDNQDYTTTAMRILASGWMRRLWTLQEAYLSRKLLFAFKHSDEDDEESKCPPLIDLDEIEAWYHESSPSLVSDLPALARSYYNNLLGPDRNARNNKDIVTNGMSLIASVWRAAQWRVSGTHASSQFAFLLIAFPEYIAQ